MPRDLTNGVARAKQYSVERGPTVLRLFNCSDSVSHGNGRYVSAFGYLKTTLFIRITDLLCRLVVRVSGFLGSIPGASKFSEKQWVWNGVHSAS
jgi:hypothetical protein